MNKPVLSICIPTYNRAQLLEATLRSLVPQVRDLGEDVELIVSDNCSTDNTATVVEAAKLLAPIRYHRNDRNIGGTLNFIRVTNELSKGEFAWIIGDDDIVRPDGLRRIIAVLKAYHEIDFVFVNTTTKGSEERVNAEKYRTSVDAADLLPTQAKWLTDRYVEKWEELIDPKGDPVFLGALMCSVFRLRLWKQYNLLVGDASDFSSLEHTYPHAVIFANTMYKSKAYYIGYPCTINFYGGQGWVGYVPMILTVRLQELLDLYQRIGIDWNRVESCRRALLSHSGDAFVKLLLDPSTPGREYFSLSDFLKRNRFHKFLLINVFLRAFPKTLVKIILPLPMQTAIRSLKRRIKTFREENHGGKIPPPKEAGNIR